LKYRCTGDQSGTLDIGKKESQTAREEADAQPLAQEPGEEPDQAFRSDARRGNATTAQEQFRALTKKLDKVACTSTMHKKTAARKKSRLAKKLNAWQAKQKA